MCAIGYSLVKIAVYAVFPVSTTCYFVAVGSPICRHSLYPVMNYFDWDLFLKSIFLRNVIFRCHYTVCNVFISL